ncbi:hypothetical protein ACWEQG_01500 [Microbispora sp. NPDC004025]
MSVNASALRETLAHIEALPNLEGWQQGSYRCESGMCFAGWRCDLSGGQWATGIDDMRTVRFPDHEPWFAASCLVAEPGDTYVAELDGVRVTPAHHRAARLLGLNEGQAAELFDGVNDLGDLRENVGLLIGTVPHVTIEAVPDAGRDRAAAERDEETILAARLVIAEVRPDQPTAYHRREDWIPLEAMPSHARRVAEVLGLPYIEPLDPAVAALLRGGEAL